MPTNEELIQAIDGLLERYNTLLTHPSEANIDALCVPKSECASNETTNGMIENGYHIEGSSATRVSDIVDAKDLSTLDETFEPGTHFWVQFHFDWASIQPGRLVDSDGELVSEISFEESDKPADRLIVRWPTDTELPWRFAD